MRIVVVDDDEALRNAVRRALRLEGHEVLLARDGAETLDQLAGLRADLVVLDVLMPVLDGITVCRRLRDSGDRTPILMLTAREPREPGPEPEPATARHLDVTAGGPLPQPMDHGAGGASRMAIGGAPVLGRSTTATGCVATVLLGLTLLVGPANLLLRRRNPVSTWLARDIGTWATITSIVHMVLGFQVHGNTARCGS